MSDSDVSRYQRHIGIAIDEITDEIRRIVGTVTNEVSLISRVKNPETLKEKMLIKKVSNVLLIDDVYGIRVILNSVNEAYQVLKKMSQVFPGHLDHDYIKEPMTRPNEPHLKGKMLRLLQFIAYKNGVPFEVQITTQEFNAMNESLHGEYHRKKYPPK